MISKKLYFAGIAIAGAIIAMVAVAARGPVFGPGALPLVSVGFVVGSAIALIFGIPAIFIHTKPYQDRFNELMKIDKK